MPAAEYRARARSVFGSGALEDSHWIFAFNRCFAASFSVANERLSDFWLEAGTSDDEALDDASYQAYRDTTRAIIDALRARYGEPTRTSQGPDQLPPVEQLVGKAAPAPLCAAWHENGVAFAVSLAVDVGKGVRDLRLRFQVKAPEREWAWQAC